MSRSRQTARPGRIFRWYCQKTLPPADTCSWCGPAPAAFQSQRTVSWLSMSDRDLGITDAPNKVMPQFSSFLFVYGTLRRASEQLMAGFLRRHGRFEALAKAPGRLYDLG